MLASPCPKKGAPGWKGDCSLVCAQLRLPAGAPEVDNSLRGDHLGTPAQDSQIGLQQDVVKELVNKIAWTLGSVYRRPYSNMRAPARAYAWMIVKQVISDHGYPDKIAK